MQFKFYKNVNHEKIKFVSSAVIYFTNSMRGKGYVDEGSIGDNHLMSG